MRYDVVLIDIDDTLFDFRQSSFEALERAFARRDVSFTWEDMPAYEVYNDRLWRAFERGEIPKPLIFTERLRLYFAERGLDIDPEAFNHDYLLYLAEGYAFMPHCRELLEALHGKCRVYVVTNGDTFAQESRIARSGLAHLFDGVFMSAQLGCREPEEVLLARVGSNVGAVEGARATCGSCCRSSKTADTRLSSFALRLVLSKAVDKFWHIMAKYSLQKMVVCATL